MKAETKGDAENTNRSADTDYNPYDHREETNKRVSNFGSCANMVKSAIGTGIFTLPNAFAAVGMYTGIGGIFTLGICLTITLHMLVKTHYKMCTIEKKSFLTYEQLCQSVLATGALKDTKISRCLVLLVNVTLFASYIGISSVYVVFISGIIQEIVDPGKSVGQGSYALMLFPFLFLVNLMRNLNDITPLSIMGNLFVILSCGIGFIYAVKDGFGDTWLSIQPDMKVYPRFIGAIFFSLCSPGLILEIERNMKKPWDYEKPCGILDVGMIFVMIFYLIVSGAVYAKWGQDSKPNFIRNHPELDAATLAAFIMQVLSIYFTYGLMCYLPVLIIHEKYVINSIERSTHKRRTELLWFFLLRLGVTVITCGLGAAVPRLEIFTGLVGAICLGVLGAVIPVILYMVVNAGEYGPYKWKLYASGVLLFIGIFCTLCATVVYSIDLINFLLYGK
ncbi:proton-coupled amino acid transporter-like protein CG1139 [Leptopilina heterotoma]|uniref:proton-coupled amino acid transporter-like protein CG1139 n=1 Tax=Leptopilina heterotoma TaxID=63436 RepID=UPI001CAA0DCE|nr:proton-coupled amino acid transporter-like protein CG1139 [Leptopilina heterotoma]